MSMFNMDAGYSAQEIKKYIKPGIYNAVFKGVTKEVKEGRDGNQINSLNIVFDIEGFGEYTYSRLEPLDNVRKDGMYGPNASMLDHFMISIRHLIDVANPTVAEAIDKGDTKISAKSFNEFVNIIKGYTDGFIGQKTCVKLIPSKSTDRNTGETRYYTNMPAYPARISKSGQPYLISKFIGSDLTMTAQEQALITASETASPTPMKHQTKSTDGMMADYDSNSDDDLNYDDLPF